MTERQKAWAAVAVEALQAADSWTGRIHIHKHLFVMQVLGLAEVPFEFELYQYGPYSFGLDYAIGEMETYGEVEKYYRRAGYGPSYRLTGINAPVDEQLTKEEIGSATRAATVLSRFDSGELELIATCLWVTKMEQVVGDPSIVERVRTIKPKYSLPQIERALVLARQVERDLSR